MAQSIQKCPWMMGLEEGVLDSQRGGRPCQKEVPLESHLLQLFQLPGKGPPFWKEVAEGVLRQAPGQITGVAQCMATPVPYR